MELNIKREKAYEIAKRNSVGAPKGLNKQNKLKAEACAQLFKNNKLLVFEIC